MHPWRGQEGADQIIVHSSLSNNRIEYLSSSFRVTDVIYDLIFDREVEKRWWKKLGRIWDFLVAKSIYTKNLKTVENYKRNDNWQIDDVCLAVLY